MTDPAFGEIEFHVEAWDGIVPFDFDQTCMTEFAVHIWADQSGPTVAQQRTFEGLQARYRELWPSIAEALLGCHPALNSTKEVEDSLSPTVGCYMEDVANPEHNEFELVYGFDREGENGRGFFVRISGWRVIEAVLAE